jgi:hypothetical protein
VPARGVADEDDAGAVERVTRDQLVDELDRGEDFIAGVGPAAADIADGVVLDVPRGDPGLA